MHPAPACQITVSAGTTHATGRVCSLRRPLVPRLASGSHDAYPVKGRCAPDCVLSFAPLLSTSEIHALWQGRGAQPPKKKMGAVTERPTAACTCAYGTRAPSSVRNRACGAGSLSLFSLFLSLSFSPSLPLPFPLSCGILRCTSFAACCLTKRTPGQEELGALGASSSPPLLSFPPPPFFYLPPSPPLTPFPLFPLPLFLGVPTVISPKSYPTSEFFFFENLPY